MDWGEFGDSKWREKKTISTTGKSLANVFLSRYSCVCDVGVSVS